MPASAVMTAKPCTASPAFVAVVSRFASATTSRASDTPSRPASPAEVLQLHASELLAYGACLEWELLGLKVGAWSATRELNHRANRRWGCRDWWLLLAPDYRRLVGDLRHQPA